MAELLGFDGWQAMGNRLSLYQLQCKSTSHFFLVSVGKYATEVSCLTRNFRSIPSLWGTRAHDSSPLLLTGFGWEGGEHSRRFGSWVFFEVRM